MPGLFHKVLGAGVVVWGLANQRFGWQVPTPVHPSLSELDQMLCTQLETRTTTTSTTTTDGSTEETPAIQCVAIHCSINLLAQLSP